MSLSADLHGEAEALRAMDDPDFVEVLANFQRYAREAQRLERVAETICRAVLVDPAKQSDPVEVAEDAARYFLTELSELRKLLTAALADRNRLQDQVIALERAIEDRDMMEGA